MNYVAGLDLGNRPPELAARNQEQLQRLLPARAETPERERGYAAVIGRILTLTVTLDKADPAALAAALTQGTRYTQEQAVEKVAAATSEPPGGPWEASEELGRFARDCYQQAVVRPSRAAQPKQKKTRQAGQRQ